MISFCFFVFIILFSLLHPLLSPNPQPHPRSEQNLFVFHWGSWFCSLCMWWLDSVVHQWQWKKEALTLSFCDCLILFLSSIHRTLGSSCSFSLHSFLFIYSLDWRMAIVLLLTFRGRNFTGHSPKADECEVIIRLTFRCLLKVGGWLVSRHRTNLPN